MSDFQADVEDEGSDDENPSDLEGDQVDDKDDGQEGDIRTAGPSERTPEELYDLLQSDERFAVVDVRDRDEFETWHVEGGPAEVVQIPFARFVEAQVKGTTPDLVADLPEPIVTVCARGRSSADAAAQLREAGVRAANLAGGMEGWAGLLVSHDVEHPDATVLQYERPASGCLGYLVVADGEAAVVDPLRAFADRYGADAAARDATLAYALDTHVHADHVSGVREVAAQTGAEAVLPAGAGARGLAFDARLVEDGESLPLGETELIARQLPGHTSEMTGFGLGGDGASNDAAGSAPALWFTGDTVFLDAVARPDLEAGDDGASALAERLYDTLHERVLTWPDDARLAPGHRQGGLAPGPHVTTVADLRGRLEVLSLDREAFVERLVSRMPPQPANFETIVEANLGRKDLADAEAFEVELGPNNCAAG